MGRPIIEIFVTMSPSVPELGASVPESGTPGTSVPESGVTGPSVPESGVSGTPVHTLSTQFAMTFGSQLPSCRHVPAQANKAAISQLERDKFSWPCYGDLGIIGARIRWI